jgi:hypothetical protein
MNPRAQRSGGSISFVITTNILSEHTFALSLLTRQFARTTDRFGLLTGFLDRGLLEMLLELHFTKDTLTLKFLLQSTKSLFDIVVTNTYLHVVFTTFLS